MNEDRVIRFRVQINDSLVYLDIENDNENDSHFRLQTHVYGGDTISLAEMTECDECSILNRRAFIEFGVTQCRNLMRDEAIRRGYEVQEWSD